MFYCSVQLWRKPPFALITACRIVGNVSLTLSCRTTYIYIYIYRTANLQMLHFIYY